MRWTSLLAIYFIMWFFCLFLVLPFHARGGTGEDIPHVTGQADSAPPRIRPWRIIWQTSLVSAVMLRLFYANYVNCWVTLRDIDVSPPQFSK